jgi:hypothetical protein
MQNNANALFCLDSLELMIPKIKLYFTARFSNFIRRNLSADSSLWPP